MLGGKSIHPAWAVPGGVRSSLPVEKRDQIKAMLPESFETIEVALDLLKDRFDQFAPEISAYGEFPSLFMGLVTPEGGLEHYDGLLRIVDGTGRILEDGVAPERYRDIIGEAVADWSYLKFPYYKPYGPGEAGMYRVGPLARLKWGRLYKGRGWNKGLD